MNRRSGLKTKEKILDAAMKVFSTSGHAGANIREIAKTAGISIGGVYLYFRNKEELYLSLVKDRISEQHLKTREAIESAESPEAALRAFLSLHLAHGVENKELILINIREHGFAFGKEIKRKFFRTQIGLLVQILEKGITNGEFRKCNTEETARIIMASLRGIVLTMAIEDESGITEKGLGDLMSKGLLRTAGKDAWGGTGEKSRPAKKRILKREK